ncbi:MAG TPA: hypothetical protein VIM69_04330 [Opitutaceae bacterium]
MRSSKLSVDLAYAKVIAAFADDPRSRIGGTNKKAFGASALRVDNKIFAMLSSKAAFVLKMPKVRVDELINQGRGVRFEPREGRPMKEWIQMTEEPNVKEWVKLAKEAQLFVGGQP